MKKKLFYKAEAETFALCGLNQIFDMKALDLKLKNAFTLLQFHKYLARYKKKSQYLIVTLLKM